MASSTPTNSPTPAKVVTLKLVIDKKEQRVLFAEADKDFVDFLFSFFLLPVGTVMRLLDNRNTIGSLSTLHKSISDLNNDHRIPSKKNCILLLNVNASTPPFSPLLLAEAFAPSWSCTPSYGTTDAFDPYLGHAFDTKLEGEETRGGGFVKGLTYMVTDDLVVSPMSTVSNVALLSKFNIKDFGVLEEKVVHISEDEGLDLLRRSFTSKTVLNDVFLDKVISKD